MGPVRGQDAPAEDIGVLDEIYRRLAQRAPEFAGGLSNHGPMAAEALVRLGRADAAPRWAERYARRLDPAAAGGRVLAPDERAGALGNPRRYGDWCATYAAALEEQPWQTVVADALGAMLPGVVSAAGHCLIRSAHAVRALEEADTPARRAELARALGYWAAVYAELPGTPVPAGALGPGAAARALPRLPEEMRAGGHITDKVTAVGRLATWEASVDRVAAPADVPAALSELTRTFARGYLAEAGSDAVAFVHGVTAPAAARLVMAYVAPARHGEVFAYAWQLCAALRVAIGSAPAPGDTGAGRAGAGLSVAGPSVEELAERAVHTGDEHAIKLAEACVREHRLVPDQVYAAAALDACARL